VVTLAGPSRTHLALALALLSWPSFARIVRSLVIQNRSASYVEAARAIGASGPRIVLRHLLPSTLAVLPTKLILTVRFAMFTETTLAFLGLADSSQPSWGSMLSWAFNDPLLFARSVWPWLVLPPVLAIATLVLATTWIVGGLPLGPLTVHAARQTEVTSSDAPVARTAPGTGTSGAPRLSSSRS